MLDTQKIHSYIFESLQTEDFHTGIIWAVGLCNAFETFFKAEMDVNICFYLNENPQHNTIRYDSAYVEIEKKTNNYKVFLGLGLFKNIIEGITNHERQKINKCLEAFPHKGEIYEALAHNYIFLSALFIFVNHEIMHAIFKHTPKGKSTSELYYQEVCADCCAGQLMEMIYDNLLLNLEQQFPEIEKSKDVTSALMIIGILYAVWKLNSIYTNAKGDTHPKFIDRPMFIGGSFILSLKENGLSEQAMKYNLFYLYNMFYSITIDKFNSFFAEKIITCMPCYEEIYEINQQKKPSPPPSTSTT